MKHTPFELGASADIHDLYEVAVLGRPVTLSKACAGDLAKCRAALMAHIAKTGAVYGINTGFGELASRMVPGNDCRQLQLNLVRSHACGVGEPFGDAQARGLWFLRANELARCHSGVRPEVVETLAACLNKGLVPHIPQKGSVGASGDLAPSAHAALVLIGEGKARVAGPDGLTDWLPGAMALEKAGIAPLQLHEKEGLALINGTQAMQALGGLALMNSIKVWHAATVAAAMSLEALKASSAPFDAPIHDLKPHAGQVETAALIRNFLQDSEIRMSHINNDPRVQDSYSLRCIAQVHGAVRDTLENSIKTVETELGSATDNPLVIWKKSGGEFKNIQTISGGNFHGQAISMAFDFACSAMVSLGNICERRAFQLISDPTKILPPYLTRNSGLESGWMITQYTAAAIASENKTLAHPASADSIPTSGNKEDFVSMGMWAAQKLDRVAGNTAYIVAIELMAAAQGIDCHKPLAPGKGTAAAHKKVRKLVAETKSDVSLSESIEKVRAAVLDGAFLSL
ncbi:MAG: histidine ammonia-lyase [Elusimicrobiaceae bacterium]|nr:histidine ammonia-lyase [Elusimicrobiaceae bacterium]